MKSRYKNNTLKKLRDGRAVYQSKIYPDIPPRNDDIFIVVQEGDRLDTIAYDYYKDQTLWWIIKSANNINDAVFTLKPGTVLRIPVNKNSIINNFID